MQTLRTVTTRPFSSPVTLPRRALVRVRASDNPFDGPSPPPAQPKVSDEEREKALELLERRSRGQIAKAKKQIPIRGQVQQKPNEEEQGGNMAPWKEGQLFPEGWEQMSWPQRVTELYMGRRGMLFWANKAAYASVFILIGGWIIFRFVGPNLGLYNLQGDLQIPQF